MEPIEVFKKMRDVCDEIVKALESEDEERTEAAVGKFLLLALQVGALKD